MTSTSGRFRKFLKELVLATQGLVKSLAATAIDASSAAAALRTLAALMKQEFEQDYLELACRLYEAWQGSQKAAAVKTIARVTDRGVGRRLCWAFVLFTERCREPKLDQRLSSKPLTGFFPGRQQLPKSHKSSPQPVSKSCPGPKSLQLLQSATTSTSLLKELYSERPTPLRPGLSRLYEDHIHRKIKAAARREAKEAVEAQSESFHPVVNNTNLPPRVKIPVFERLSYDSKPNYSVSSEEREYLSSSFSPSLTSKQYFAVGASVKEMHSRSLSTAQKIRKMQLEAHAKELLSCSFVPAKTPKLSRSSSFTSTASSKSIFDRLYLVPTSQIHEKTQRKLREKAAKQAEDEAKRSSFQPVINAKRNSSFDSSHSSASQRLFADSKVRAEKLDRLRAQYQQSSLRARSLPVLALRPAYERLYDLHRDQKHRRAELRARVMQEEGVTFAPSLHLYPKH